MSQSGSKPYEISKQVVMAAFEKVRSKKGAPGIDGVTVEQFAQDGKNNLYKLWNRMSSGSYFQSPVRMVEIPKDAGRGTRVLGVPTVADRIAQTVAVAYLEPVVEKLFHADSYGYRPGRSPLDAVATCRARCWKYSWVLDLDIEGFFDNLDHDLILKAVAHHTDDKWILMYVSRWLSAPLAQPDGTLVSRDRGSPQGASISPLLANLCMHYAFDTWMAREFPEIPFERFVDDVIVHCVSQQQARRLRDAIATRLAECGGLRLHPTKTRIEYCKMTGRYGSCEHITFDFLGYTFKPRGAEKKDGKISFIPRLSDRHCVTTCVRIPTGVRSDVAGIEARSSTTERCGRSGSPAANGRDQAEHTEERRHRHRHRPRALSHGLQRDAGEPPPRCRRVGPSVFQ